MDGMKVTLAQHGGQAAAINLSRPSHLIDSADLEESEAAELKGLVVAAVAAPSSAERSGKARGEMSYTITIQDDLGRETVLKESDTTRSSDFGKLLLWLQRHSRS
jgi:hypothetical protein